jgi:uncharacterized protein YyaL (SSP411 family)
VRSSLASTYLPDAVVAPRPGADDDLDAWLTTLGLEEAPPIWRGRTERDGEPTIYLCEGRVCSPPTHSLSEALAWFSADTDDE